MGRRKKHSRRSSNSIGSVVSDSAAIANGLGAKGALIVGIVGFLTFYFFLPFVLAAWADYNKAKMVGPLAPVFEKLLDGVLFRRFIHPCEWAGIAILLVCAAVATWKVVTQTNLERDGEHNVTVLGKLLARFLD